MGKCCSKDDGAKTRSQHIHGRRDFKKDGKKHTSMQKKVDEEPLVCSHENIRHFYSFKRVMGHGHFGTVRIASSVTNEAHKFAIKGIDKTKLRRDLHLLNRELAILRKVDHPNIIRFYETYQDEKFFYFVMELCTGGDLLEHFIQKKHLSEFEVANIMQKAFSAVKHLHKIGIAHRDLKPENFLFESKEPDAELKLIDFGLSKYFGDDPYTPLKTQVGSPLYVAPEVLEGQYDERCDNWSMGVIMYLLLGGTPPFDGNHPDEVFEKIKHSKPKFPMNVWKSVSKEARQLIAGLLEKDPDQRLTAAEALDHEWFQGKIKKAQADSATVVKIGDSLSHFKAHKRFQNEILKVMITYLSEEELHELREAFRVFDREDKGQITIDEFSKAMKDLGHEMSSKEIEDMIKTMKLDKSNQMTINYTEFIAATMDKQSYLNKERLWDAFKHFEVDNTGVITVESIKDAFARAGREVPEEELKKMVKEVDIDKAGKINFDEFVRIMNLDGDGFDSGQSGSVKSATIKRISLSGRPSGDLIKPIKIEMATQNTKDYAFSPVDSGILSHKPTITPKENKPPTSSLSPIKERENSQASPERNSATELDKEIKGPGKSAFSCQNADSLKSN